MKKNLLVLLTTLLTTLQLVSSDVFSQNSDEANTASFDTSSATQSLSQSLNKIQNTDNKQSDLLLAKILEKTSTDVMDSNNLSQPLSDAINSNKTKAENYIAQTKKISDEELNALRQLFLQAENAIKKNNDAEYFLLAEKLKDYPLAPFLQYQWLKKHLDNETKIKEFLKQHKSSRYASRLKRKWLHHLAKHKQWTIFLQFYNTSKNTKLRCYYHQAQLETGNKKVALKGAKELWVVGYSQPAECDPLFARLIKSSLFTQDLLWQRFDAAVQNNKISLAVYVKSFMSQAYHADAQLWLNLHHNPSHYISHLLDLSKTDQSALMFTHAINRLVNNDFATAITLWDTHKQEFNIDKTLADKLEKRLALQLAFEREMDAYHRLSQLNTTTYTSRAWRVRAALIKQNWDKVITAIQALNETEIKKQQWQYWLARAYLETDKVEKAQAILTELSTKRSYYGFLAANKINSLYQLSDNPIIISSEEITRLKYRKEFRVAFELKILARETEAKLQWWHALRQLNNNEIPTAAKLAQQWQWDEIAIFTIAKAKHWDDIEMRFPLSFVDKIHKNSKLHGLNPSIIFGLIRRESAFNDDALSPAGARGLMQIMPQTGRQIARHFNEPWQGSNSLFNPALNLRYGSYYYQKLLTRFDGNHVIALAAYNAGSNRVKKWLPETEALPADIWIETIPFYETRKYIAAVLTYALIYQQRTQYSNAAVGKLSMNYLVRDVLPLSSVQ